MAGRRPGARWLGLIAALSQGAFSQMPEGAPQPTSDRCLACHNGVAGPSGEDVSIGSAWRASMMANSARDPYWQAAVRREVMDFPGARAEIEAECARCHMPLARLSEGPGRAPQGVFEHLPIGRADGPGAPEAADGVSCLVCHAIAPDGLGEGSTFSGRFAVVAAEADSIQPVFGPFEVEAGHAAIMSSATGARPGPAPHIQSSELCASCHTLFTHTPRGDRTVAPADGSGFSGFPEQTPYLEWRLSAFPDRGRSCQSCHMPEVDVPVPVTSVLGVERPNVSRHVFRGGNFFMLRMLSRFRDALGVVAPEADLEASARATEDHLRSSTAEISIAAEPAGPGQRSFAVTVRNLAGHKFPTGYPSRRAWLHVVVTDADGDTVFESGALRPDGRIVGNANDEDAAAFESHLQEITRPDQVQVYEAVLGDASGGVTTGLLSAAEYLKDNRLLPDGYGDDREAAPMDTERFTAATAVHGAARDDPDFDGGGDRVRYRVAVDPDGAPFSVEVNLWFQPIGWRWAANLGRYDAVEPERFLGYFEQMADASALVVAAAAVPLR